MAHIFKKRFKKNTRNMARTNSNNTIIAKKYIRELDKQDVTKNNTNK